MIITLQVKGTVVMSPRGRAHDILHSLDVPRGPTVAWSQKGITEGGNFRLQPELIFLFYATAGGLFYL